MPVKVAAPGRSRSSRAPSRGSTSGRRRSRSSGARPPRGELTRDAGRGHADPRSRGRSSCASRARLLGPLELSKRAFKPSETTPAVVVLRAGRVVRTARREHGRAGAPPRRRALDGQGQAARPARAAARPAPRPLRVRADRPRPRAARCSSPAPTALRVFAWPTGGGPPAVRSVAIHDPVNPRRPHHAAVIDSAPANGHSTQGV